MKQELNKKILVLESKAKMLKRVCDIRNILLSNGGYSIRNMEKQEIQFTNANVPEWEREIIRTSWKATSSLSHDLFKELDILSNEIINENNNNIISKKELTTKYILKEKLKKKVDLL